MRRREFIAGLSTAAIRLLGARAQQPAKMKRVVMVNEIAEAQPPLSALTS
jgi:hypothetical protein